jgi:hypothetical protein
MCTPCARPGRRQAPGTPTARTTHVCCVSHACAVCVPAVRGTCARCHAAARVLIAAIACHRDAVAAVATTAGACCCAAVAPRGTMVFASHLCRCGATGGQRQALPAAPGAPTHPTKHQIQKPYPQVPKYHRPAHAPRVSDFFCCPAPPAPTAHKAVTPAAPHALPRAKPTFLPFNTAAHMLQRARRRLARGVWRDRHTAELTDTRWHGAMALGSGSGTAPPRRPALRDLTLLCCTTHGCVCARDVTPGPHAGSPPDRHPPPHHLGSHDCRTADAVGGRACVRAAGPHVLHCAVGCSIHAAGVGG